MKAGIVTLPGDGIGVEVVAEGVKVLDAVGRTYGHTFTFQECLIGGAAIDAVGDPLPEARSPRARHGRRRAAGCCRRTEVVGPVRKDPTGQGLLGLRKGLGLYANLRPVRIYKELRDASPLKVERLEGVDLVVVRELTGGIYFGPRQEATVENPEAFDTMLYSADEIRRIVRKAFELARLGVAS